jgi:hypothetical protein
MMQVRVKLGKLIFLASLAKDPQNWISLIAVVTLLGLCGGVFDPNEGRQDAQMARADGSARWVALQAQADEAGERL